MKLILFAGMLIVATAGIARADAVSETGSGLVSISNPANYSDVQTEAEFFQSNPDALKIGTQSKPIEPFWWEVVVGGVFLAAGLIFLLALP